VCNCCTLHMQTFLPFPNFTASVALLDRQRLGKQRVENLQILKALKVGGGLHGGWTKHPASRMWEGYELALLKYQEATCNEWVVNRGYKDTCWQKSLDCFTEDEIKDYYMGDYVMPPWFGDKDFHKAHASNLLRKDPIFYAGKVGTDDPTLDYIWPIPLIK
jgi:hypothetical protein